MTQTHPHALPNLFDLLRVDGPDLAMDVAGGNPYSPVWICRLEPNDGNNVWRRFERAAKWGSDPAAITSFENYGVLKDEYRTLSSALVAALTNEDFLIWLDAAQSDDERRELTEGFVREHKILTWGGHGFLMNAGVLSLAAYDDWEKSHFFYGPESLLKCSVKDAFLASGIQSLKEYRERATQVFTAHVQARLRRYQPRLILCQGRKGSKDYLRLFLSEWERKPFLRYGGGGFPSRRFELYFHEETGTVVAICNVLKERKKRGDSPRGHRALCPRAEASARARLASQNADRSPAIRELSPGRPSSVGLRGASEKDEGNLRLRGILRRRIFQKGGGLRAS